MADKANANPTKEFFIEMLTRDIALEDAILDLLDNCIDSLARTRNLPLSEALLDSKIIKRHVDSFKKTGIPHVNITFDETSFMVEDNCGGISYDSAKEEVFRFGKVTDAKDARLSVYGIGLKRAMFKLGKDILIESKTTRDGFLVKINVDEWANNDEWSFPLEPARPAASDDRAGTKITVRELNTEVKLRMRDGQFLSRVSEFISTTYSLLLGRFVVVRVNGTRVEPQPIPIGGSSEVTPARDQFEIEHVKVTLLAGLAQRVDGEWQAETAGWYILCNGRVVLFADKSELSGWGTTVAEFVPKYRGFVGIAFFFSEDPEALPWTTTKRGLNTGSRAYMVARNKMTVIAKPVIGFLNRMYSAAETEEPVERQIANSLKSVNIVDLLKNSGRSFSIKDLSRRIRPSLVSIQFKVPLAKVERVKKYLRKPMWSNSRIGQHTFDYFVDHECPE